MKYEKEVTLELKKTENLLERAKTANNLRDKISRAYYACYHAMIAAIWTIGNFSETNLDTAHRRVLEEYISNFSKTKGTRIVLIKNVARVVQKWKNLRCAADYDIFTSDFENTLIRDTEEELIKMYQFIDMHIIFIESKLIL